MRISRGPVIFVLALAIAVGRMDRAQTTGASSPIPLDLGTLGGANSYATAINGSGQVVGASQIANGDYHAFIWSAATGMIDLGTLAGPDTVPTAISDNGQVVGASGDQAFSWTAGGGMVSLGPIGLSLAYTVPAPRAVNNSGQVAANNVASCPDRTTAFVWSAAAGKAFIPGLVDPATLPCPLGPTIAFGLNGSGEAVGKSVASVSYFFPWIVYHAVTWTPATGVQDLGTLEANPTANSVAVAVNDSGQVAGFDFVPWPAPFPPPTHAFLWSAATGMIDVGLSDQNVLLNASGRVAGTVPINKFVSRAFTWTLLGGRTELGTLGGGSSWGFGLSDAGQIVGRSDLSLSYPDSHAFAWTPSGGMVDLGTLGGTISEARAVNGAGQIAGASYLPGNAVQHAVVWNADPTQLLAQLIAATAQANFQQGSRLLENALNSLTRRNTLATCGQVGAFMNQVQAQRGKGLPIGVADQWLLSARQLWMVLGCR